MPFQSRKSQTLLQILEQIEINKLHLVGKMPTAEDLEVLYFVF